MMQNHHDRICHSGKSNIDQDNNSQIQLAPAFDVAKKLMLDWSSSKNFFEDVHHENSRA
jgi:hypothetical protein